MVFPVINTLKTIRFRLLTLSSHKFGVSHTSKKKYEMAVRAVQHDPSDDSDYQGWPSVGKGRESLPTTGVRTCVSLFLLVPFAVAVVDWGGGCRVQSATVTVPEKWGSGSVRQVAVV